MKYLIIALIVGIVAAVIDALLHISYPNFVAQVIHKVVYMTYGVMLYRALNSK